MGKDKSEKFRTLAEKRVTSALKQMKLIGNLSSRSNYSYTEEQVEMILKALKQGVKDVERRFSEAQAHDTDIEFRF